MTEQEFQKLVLGALSDIQSDVGTLKSDVVSLNTRFDRMEIKLDKVSSDLTEFKENQNGFNDAIWNLNTQSFQAVNEVRSEVLPPWKARKASMV